MVIKKSIFALLTGVFIALPGLCLAETWSVPGDFPSIQKAINSPKVVDGDEIDVAPGLYFGAVVTKSVAIRGSGNSYIVNGPKPWKGRTMNAGFMFRGPKAENGSGTKISDFVFRDVDFPIFASQWGAVVSDVSVQHCTFENAVQAITMWHADNWDVRFNEIKDLEALNGGGIGILIGSYSGDDAFDNLIEQNLITGTVFVDRRDVGGYNAAGIVLVSDRQGKHRGGLVEGNLVSRNTIQLVSTDSQLVPVVGIELLDTRAVKRSASVIDNEVSDNNLSGAADDIILEPIRLDDINDVQD